MARPTKRKFGGGKVCMPCTRWGTTHSRGTRCSTCGQAWKGPLQQHKQNSMSPSLGKSLHEENNTDNRCGIAEVLEGDNNDSRSSINEELLQDNDDEESLEAEVEGNEDGDLHMCANCKRKETLHSNQDLDSIYNLEFVLCEPGAIRTRKKFSSLRRGDISLLGEQVLLCKQCHEYLVRQPGNRGMVDVWPSFMWRMLTHTKVLEEMGTAVWRFVPMVWRAWWVDNWREWITNEWRGENLEEELPPASVCEVSLSRNELLGALKRLRLVELMEAVDTHLMPSVRCPWGCTEFLHKVEYMALDVVWAHYIGPSLDIFAPSCAISTVRGARRDYLDSENNDCVLMNPKWRIVPSIAYFEDKGPCILVCRNHGGGSRMDYIHVPRPPWGVFASSRSDQLAHAVVVPRTIRPMKASAYSDSYQMHEMRGSYAGIDTLSVVDYGRFDFISTLTQKNESIMISGRCDIRGLVARNTELGVIPASVADGLLEDARRDAIVCTGEDWWISYCKSATYVPFKDAMKLQMCVDVTGSLEVRVPIRELLDSDEDNEGEDAGEDHDDGDLQDTDDEADISIAEDEQGVPVQGAMEEGEVDYEVRSIIGTWPREIFWVHPVDKYGAPFPRIPGYRCHGCDTRYLWFLTGMLVSVPEMWSCCGKNVRATWEWPGWILTYVTRVCFPHRRCIGSKNNPFRGSSKLNPQALAARISLSEEGVVGSDALFAESLRLLNGVFVSRSENMVALEDVSAKIVVVVKASRFPERSTLAFQSMLARSEEGWELRYLGSGWATNTGVWDGIAYFRHGGNAFPGWWVHRRMARGPQHSQTLVGTLPEHIVATWDVAVFVKDDDTSWEELRDNFLYYVGGQKTYYCQTHKMPLIAATKQQSACLTCSMAPEPAALANDNIVKCSRVIGVTCPAVGCVTSLCKKHAEVRSRSDKVYVEPRDGQQSDRSDFYGMEADGSDSLSAGGSVSDGDRGVDHMEPDGGLEESHVVSDEDDVSSTAPQSLLRLTDTFPELYVCDADKMDDEVDDGGSSSDESSGRAYLPLTNAGRKAVPVWSARSYVDGHVILNNCGTCLIRRSGVLRPKRYQAAFLERLVATTDGQSIPLVYPEAMLFPSIFFKDMEDGSMVGAIPAAAMSGERECRRLGLASLSEHMRIRLTDPSLRTSTDPRYNFYAFDAVANVNLRGQDSRVVLSRGFVEEQGSGGVRAGGNRTFYTDSIDSRPVVRRLAAALAEKPATYFFTQTCNQSSFFGVRKLRAWLESPEFEEILVDTYGHDMVQEDEFRKAIRSSACIPILRNWMEVSEIFMNYLLNSEEKPVGDVERMFWRHENQDTVGNLTHIHAIIWTRDSQDSVIRGRIRGSVPSLVTPEEAVHFVEEGLMESMEELEVVRHEARKFLFHTCSSRCLRRTGPGEHDFECRVPNTARDSPRPAEDVMRVIEPHHSEQAIAILEELGLCHRESTPDHFIPLDDRLVNERYYPACESGSRPMSPTNGRLFVATRSASNLQLCTNYFSCRYLAKYVAGIDENNAVYAAAAEVILPDAGDVRMDRVLGSERVVPDSSPAISMESHFLHNTKISSSARYEKEAHGKKNYARRPKGRAISVVEAVALVLGYPQVYTNMQFVDVPSTAMDERAGMDRVKPVDHLREIQSRRGEFDPIHSPADIDPGRYLPICRVRNSLSLPPWRQLTATEVTLLQDQMFSPVTVDKITVFGARPPELRFVRHPGLYFRWFARSQCVTKDATAYALHEELVDEELEKSGWVDGLNSCIRVRRDALAEIVAYVDANVGVVPRAMGRLLVRLERYCRLPPTRQHERELMALWSDRLLDNERSIGPCLPVVVYSNIRPTQPQRFIVHILLSMGAYNNELELFCSGDLRSVFAQTGLLDLSNAEVSVLRLVRRYILTQLLFVPGGTSMFDRYVVAAYSVLRGALIAGDIPINEMPSVLYTSLRQQTSEKVLAHLSQCRLTLATALVGRVQCIPEYSQVGSAENFALSTRARSSVLPVALEHAAVQSDASFEEQNFAFGRGRSLLDKYCAAGLTQVKCLCIVGGPGCGKTFIMNLLLLEAMRRGLNVMVTALMSERSLVLGGLHLHKLFQLPVREGGSVHRLAELALYRLYKCPEALALLQCLDVLGVDEYGQLASEVGSVADMVLRRVRHSDQFMGGLLLVATMDPHQLRPIFGHPALMSPSMLTCFTFANLVESVRAGGDRRLQRIQAITRMVATMYTEDILREFRMLALESFTFVDSWEDRRITDSTLRVFGRHLAVRFAEAQLLDHIKSRNQTIRVADSQDYELSPQSHSSWVPATAPAVRFLDKKTKEIKRVHFYEGAVYEMTFNRKGIFSQSQLAVLLEMPSAEAIANGQDVRIMVAPEGCKNVPTDVPARLTEFGWTATTVGMAPEHVHTMWGGVKTKRRQYGIRHRIASTIHAVMGSDVGKLATSVSTSDPKYRLWENEQVVVLLSRTSRAPDLIFVGDPEETVRALIGLIQIRSQYSEYMQHVLTVMSGSLARDFPPAAPVVELAHHPFRPIDVPLPEDNSGFCYILVSLQDSETTYIGQTRRLIARLQAHNSGNGASTTSDARLRPWALLAFVCGFDGDRPAMRRFERDWQRKRDRGRYTDGPLSPLQTADLARTVIGDWNEIPGNGPDLRFVRTGTMGITLD